MSELIGETQHLFTDKLQFSSVLVLVGDHGCFHTKLLDLPNFASLIAPHAKVQLVEDTLSCEIFGSDEPDKATAVYVAIIPERERTSYPASVSDILKIPNSVKIGQSVYSSDVIKQLRFNVECTHLFKPKPYSGCLPEFVYYWKVTGGLPTTETIIRFSGTLQVSGAGFVDSWV